MGLSRRLGGTGHPGAIISGTDHGTLVGLSDDDHPQYLLVDGTRAMDIDLLFTDQGSSPGTPASGFGKIYTKTDGKLYHKNDAGEESDLTVSDDNITQELITTENISASDTTLADPLSTAPKNALGVVLLLNGVAQSQGAGLDYQLTGGSLVDILWLADTGTAVDMATTDVLLAVYEV